jgi:hypothetical protein
VNDSVGRSEVHGRNQCSSLHRCEDILAIVIELLNDIKFVRILAHVTRMFDPALTTEDASLKRNVLYSSPNPGDPTMSG